MKKIFDFIRDNSGNVILEFTVTAVALFIPISYISIAATQIASGYIDVQNAARAGARIFAASEVDSSGKRATVELIKAMLSGSNDPVINFYCTKNPCLSKDGIVTVQIQKAIVLDLPIALGSPQVIVTGKQAEVVQDAR